MDVTPLLMNCMSHDQTTRQAAEQQIEQAKASNLPLLMSLMATELANEAKEGPVRQGAGLVLKNCLSAKDDAKQAALAEQWIAFDATAKAQIKQSVFGCLGSADRGARDVAAQVVAAAATIELPKGQWLDVIQALTNNVTASSSNELKQSSLKVLGYICEEIDPEVLEAQSNLILTAVVQGMRKEETDPEVRLAGTKALLNALAFVKKNFDNETERNYIMQTVCETTQADKSEIRLVAYECIVSIAETYYDLLAPYMQALYSLTLQCVERSTKDQEEDEVGQQAVEFWSTICDEELELMEEEEEAKLEERQPERRSQNYARGAVPTLVPILLEGLCKQEEDAEDDDSWNLAMASATCLSSASRAAQDLVVAPVMTFIQAHIASADWRRREAATLAFGSILEGPAPHVLQPLVAQAMPVMIGLMKDPQVQVKDTAAWTIARICEHHITFIAPEMWGLMLRTAQPGEPPEAEGALFVGLKDHPRVASNVCLALHNLAEQCEGTRDQPTNDLSGPFVDLARALLACTERADSAESNLRSSAYEALNTVLTNSAEDTKQSVLQLLPVILQRLEATFQMQLLTAEDREAQSELQGLLCGCLQVITSKLSGAIKPHADQMMHAFLQVFGAKNSTVHEEALMAVGAIANATDGDFDKYMPHFRPFLSLGLSNYEEHQVCQVAVGVVGDICRALEAKLLPYCDEILGLLLKNLQSPKLNRNVKPPILSCFGDIALAIGGHFEKYMTVTMSMLQQASQTQVDMEDDDLVDYLHQLQEGIFEAYTGVLQGLRADGKAEVFAPYIEGCFQLLVLVSRVTEQHGSTDDLLRAAVGVVGDLSSTLGPRFKQQVRQSPYKEAVKLLMKEANKSPSDQTKQVASWANGVTFH
jgi:importin subunit beta-1